MAAGAWDDCLRARRHIRSASKSCICNLAGTLIQISTQWTGAGPLPAHPRTWMEGLLRWPTLEVVCRGSCPSIMVCGLMQRNASITTCRRGGARWGGWGLRGHQRNRDGGGVASNHGEGRGL